MSPLFALYSKIIIRNKQEHKAKTNVKNYPIEQILDE